MMAPKTLLLGVGAALLLYFLYLMVKGTVSRSVAVPVGIAAGLGVLSLEAHPLVALVAAVAAYSVVARIVEVSIRWATTAVLVAAAALVVYGFQTGRLAL